MQRLVVVSNRVEAIEEGKATAGGLAAAVYAALRRVGGIWFGWSGKVVDEPPGEVSVRDIGKIRYATVDLLRDDHRLYYGSYSNESLWPLLHYRLDRFDQDRSAYDAYVRVNRDFAARILPLLTEDDRIWVHDYHLFPLGAALREAGARQKIGFFLHTPFPPRQVLVALARHRDLFASLLDYDLIGFQTEDDADCFRDYAAVELGVKIDAQGSIQSGGRICRIGAFPIGIDTDGMVRLAQSAPASEAALRLRQSAPSSHFMIGVDRLDYTKGFIERLRGFQRYLESFGDTPGKLTLVQIAAPTRETLSEYQDLRRQVASLAGEINSRFSTPEWAPIRYVNRSYSRRTLAGFYRASRVGLVTPLRDGMNLVAKEYVAAQVPDQPGVLVLSRFAGAARELDAATIVNPYDRDDIADAIHAAITMSIDERRARWAAMMAVIERNHVGAWCRTFLDRLAAGTGTNAGEPPTRRLSIV